MKAYGGVELYDHAFLISALDGGECSASRTGHTIPTERDPGPHLMRCWVDADSLTFQDSNPSRPVRTLVTILTELSRIC